VNFDFSEDQLAIRDAVEALCADFGADYWLERDRDGRWPSEFCDAVARGGWFGVTMPKEHGGAGLGISAAAMVRLRVQDVMQGAESLPGHLSFRRKRSGPYSSKSPANAGRGCCLDCCGES
jgi:acyl-CoA dehydrogenase